MYLRLFISLVLILTFVTTCKDEESIDDSKKQDPSQSTTGNEDDTIPAPNDGKCELVGYLSPQLQGNLVSTEEDKNLYTDEELVDIDLCKISEIDSETGTEIIWRTIKIEADGKCHFKNLPVMQSPILSFVSSTDPDKIIEVIVPYTEEGKKVLAEYPSKLKQVQSDIFREKLKFMSDNNNLYFDLNPELILDSSDILVDINDYQLFQDEDDPTKVVNAVIVHLGPKF